jgi:hypothetical protein
MSFRKTVTSIAALLLFCVSAVLAQDTTSGKQAQDMISGKYEGVAKSPASGDIPLTVEIKNDGGKLHGKIDSPLGSLPITGGTYADGRVNLKFDAGGNEGVVTAMLKDGKITGEWSLAGQTGTLELKKAEAVAGAKPAEPKKEEASSGDPVTGEWDAAADFQGQSIPFTLKMKLSGESISGESSSAQGSAAISKGSYTGGKLSLTLDTPNGSIVLNGTVKEGKITGDYDFAGQAQGKWEASKKKKS